MLLKVLLSKVCLDLSVLLLAALLVALVVQCYPGGAADQVTGASK